MTTTPHLTIGILEGDDIGHEVVPAAVEVAQAAAEQAGLRIDWRPLPIGRKALDELGTTLPDSTLEALESLDGWILGPIGHREYPKLEGAINPHPILRKRFDLFGNIRPAKSYPGIGCIIDPFDMIIVRENNEGFQPDRNVVMGSGEFRPTNDVSISVRVISREGSRKVAECALALAQSRPAKKLTIVHKNTVFKLGCGMFVEECYKAAEGFPDVTVDECIVDTFATRMLRDHEAFDVVVTTNMFGDILTDEAAGIVGGLGMAPALSVGKGNLAMAQATHGSAPDIAGKGIANPYAMVESTRMMFDWLGRRHGVDEAVRTAELMTAGMNAVLADPAQRTPDIKGTATQRQMVDGILAAIRNG